MVYFEGKCYVNKRAFLYFYLLNVVNVFWEFSGVTWPLN